MTARRQRRDAGTSLIEYVLLVALIAVLAMAGILYFGRSRSDSFSRTASTIGGIIVPFTPF
jgi:Flp pilus assembly pilin Flp